MGTDGQQSKHRLEPSFHVVSANMILKKMLILFVVCMGWVEANPLGGQMMRGGGTDTTNPLNVLTAQMNDMQKGSTLVAYQLASPANRAFTARPSGYNHKRFNTMVNEEPYQPLLQGFGYDVTKHGYTSTGEYFADVKVFKSRDRGYWYKYRFTMSLQPPQVQDVHYSLGAYKMAAGHRPVWRTDRVDAMIICQYCGWGK